MACDYSGACERPVYVAAVLSRPRFPLHFYFSAASVWGLFLYVCLPRRTPRGDAAAAAAIVLNASRLVLGTPPTGASGSAGHRAQAETETEGTPVFHCSRYVGTPFHKFFLPPGLPSASSTPPAIPGEYQELHLSPPFTLCHTRIARIFEENE